MGDAAHVPTHFGFSCEWDTPPATKRTAVEAKTNQCLDMDRQTSANKRDRNANEVYHAVDRCPIEA